MKLQCCFCKHIFSNFEYDEMLDCELALEQEGEEHCSKDGKFTLFELETDEKICDSFLSQYLREKQFI